MNKRIIATLIGCLCLTVQAAKYAVPVSITANGTNKTTAAVGVLADTETNYVDLAGVFITVPIGMNAEVQLSEHVAGTACLLDTWTFYGSTNAATVRFIMPRKGVTSSANPQVDRFPLVGTNTLLSVRQFATSTNAAPVAYSQTTNAWAIQLLIEQ